MASPDLSDEQLFSDLREAVTGLLYPSESDEPFQAFVWNATETDAIGQIAAMGKSNDPIKETTPADFFAELVNGDDAAGFVRLRDVLQSRLTGLRVLRFGETEVDVWVIGKSASGSWAGVQTKSIET